MAVARENRMAQIRASDGRTDECASSGTGARVTAKVSFLQTRARTNLGDYRRGRFDDAAPTARFARKTGVWRRVNSAFERVNPPIVGPKLILVASDKSQFTHCEIYPAIKINFGSTIGGNSSAATSSNPKTQYNSMKPTFRGVWLIPASFLLGFMAQSQPQNPMTAEAEERTSLAPPMSLAELEEFIGGRTLLSVELKNAPLADVASALGQAAGWKITPPLLGNTLYSLKAENAPFWEALSDHSRTIRRGRAAKDKSTVDQTQLNDFSLTKSGEKWLLREAGGMPAGYVSKSWPFLLVGTQLTRTQNAVLGDDEIQIPRKSFNLTTFPRPVAPQFGKPKTKTAAETPEVPQEKRWTDGLNFGISAFADPKIEARELTTEVLEATDELGNDLRVPLTAQKRNRNSFGGSYGGGSTPITLSLQSQPKMGKKLVKLRGNLRFLITTKVQHWETTALQTPVNGNIWQNGGEFQTQFSGLKKGAGGDGNWSLTLKAQSRGDHLRRLWNTRDLQSFLFSGWEISLTDDKGQKFRNFSRGGSYFLNRGANQTPVPLSPDLSPLPPDISNWNYEGEENFSFDAPQNFGSGAPEIKMGQPVKLSIDYPAEQREIVVPFEFDNLPLPPS